MTLPEDGALLRIFIGESDKQEGRPLVDHAIGEGLATVERVRIRFYRAGERARE